MKKLFTIITFLVLFVGSVFTSCSFDAQQFDTPQEETYVVEVGIVSNDTVDTATKMAENISGEVSNSDIFAIRDYLYANTATDDYEIEENVTFEELKSMLVQVSHTKGPEIANGIKEHGSYLGTFNHRNYSYKKIWICVTKTGLLY